MIKRECLNCFQTLKIIDFLILGKMKDPAASSVVSSGIISYSPQATWN